MRPIVNYESYEHFGVSLIIIIITIIIMWNEIGGMWNEIMWNEIGRGRVQND